MTRDAVDFTPAMDDLLRDAPVTNTVELPVLGIATCFETNSPQVLEAVEESFGCWRRLTPGAVPDSSSGVRVRVVVYRAASSDRAAAGRVAVRHICPDATRLIVQSSHAVGISDPERREALAFVADELVEDRVHFRAVVLDALTWSLLSHFDRHPVHAAALGSGNRVLLLAAPSGTGKSTISYVAQRAGLELLGDDHVWVQLEPALRIWSAPRPLRLLPQAVADFPELAVQPVIEVDGKRKISLSHDGGVGPHGYDGVVTCVMARHDAPPRLERIAPGEVAAALTAQLAPGFDRYPARQHRVTTMLAERGGWRLTLGDSAEEVLPLLLEMLDS